jgi:NAD(P)-dependent dehydrogenase (short-subunit alcohol dehydrogenase family)
MVSGVGFPGLVELVITILVVPNQDTPLPEVCGNCEIAHREVIFHLPSSVVTRYAATMTDTPQTTPVPARSVLITGCSSGIGLASALVLKQRGWRVLATARKPEDLAMLRGHGVDALHLELADAKSIDACATEALRLTGGKLTALINNAAYGQIGAVEDLTADVLRQQFEVNVIGTHDLTRRVIPTMRASKNGRIVQISSVLGLMAAPYRGAYCASKFALEALSDSLRMELHDTGITVSLIEPGPVRTRFLPNVLLAFRANVDVDASVHKTVYEQRVASIERGGKSTFKVEPEAVAKRAVHALEAVRPKPRYFVTVPTYAANILKRALPTILLDPLARGQ